MQTGFNLHGCIFNFFYQPIGKGPFVLQIVCETYFMSPIGTLWAWLH